VVIYKIQYRIGSNGAENIFPDIGSADSCQSRTDYPYDQDSLYKSQDRAQVFVYKINDGQFTEQVNDRNQYSQ
jgi:hypothetical protein